MNVADPTVDIPAIRTLARQREIVDAVPKGDGFAAFEGNDACGLPSFEHLPFGLDGWNFVGGRKGKAMADVVVAVSPVRLIIQAILRNAGQIESSVVNGVSIGITGN